MSSELFEYKTSGLNSAGPRGSSLNLDEAQGIVECFVAGIGNKDSVGDIVASGAFTKSLMRRKPRVVWGHSWNDPIGKVLEIYEVPTTDPRLPMKMKMAGIGGLFARVQFNLNSEKGKEAFANVAFFGEEQEWSIGYKTLRAQYDQKSQANVIYELELYEVSPVLHGANQLTGTISIKTDVMDSEDTYQISQFDREEMQKQLSMIYGPKAMIVQANQDDVVFSKPGSDGQPERMKCHWTRDGSNFMFGPPQRIQIPVGPTVPVSPMGTPAPVGNPAPQTQHPNRVVMRPQQMPAIPVAIKPNPMGPGTVMVPLPPVKYEDESKPVDKENLVQEEADLRDALLKIVKRHGRFNEDSTGVWAGYKSPENNPVAGIGVKCANCVFYQGGSSCKVIALPVHPEGKCRFAIIPEGVVKGSYGDQKSADDAEAKEQEDYVLELEAKYPGELLLAGLRGAVGRLKKRKRKRKFKDLSEFDENQIDEKGYCISISPEDAFGIKSMLDPIFDYYGADSFVDVQGIVIKSGISYDLIEAVDNALGNYSVKKKFQDEIEVKNLGRRLASYGASRLIDRPRLGGGRGRGGRGFGVPEGDLNPDTRVDKNRNGWLFDNIPGWEQADPTPYGPGSIYNADLTPEQRRDSGKIGPEGKPIEGEIRDQSFRPERDKPKLVSGPARPEDGEVVPMRAEKPKPQKAKRNEERRLSSGRNLSRHGLGKTHEEKFGVSRDEKTRRENFDKIAQNWVDSQMGWTEVPRNSDDKNKTESFLRGRELGVNQSRVAWLGTGKGNGKRPDNFNEKAKSSQDYAKWFYAYSGHLGNFVSALNSKENKTTPDDVKDFNSGIRNGIANEVFSKIPDTKTWEKENSENLFKWLSDYGFNPQKSRDGRLSSGFMEPEVNRGRTTRIPGLDEGFDPDNPYGDEDAPYDVGFDVYDQIIKEFLGDEPKREEATVVIPNWTDKQIYEKRMGGMTLQEVADKLRITRQEVRQRELKHMSEMRKLAASGKKKTRGPAKRKRITNLSEEDKNKIYDERIAGASAKKLAKKYNIRKINVDAVVSEISKKRKDEDSAKKTRREKEIAEAQIRQEEQEQEKLDRDNFGSLSSGASTNKKLNESGALGYVLETSSKQRRDRLSSGATLKDGELQQMFDNMSAQIIESLLKAMKNPQKGWKRPWANAEVYARNITNTKWNPDGRAYEGANQFMLSMKGSLSGYKTNRWAGPGQWKKMGGKVKDGQRPTQILAPDVINGKKVPNQFHVTEVYNVAQISGLPKAMYEPSPLKMTDEQRLETIQAVISEIGPDFREGNFGGAFYSLNKDMIFMPQFGTFDSPIAFYSTLLHEMTHWTAHPSRLGRKFGRMNAPKATDDYKKYAFEELIAEIGSSLMMGMLGLEPVFRDDHGQYLASWLENIQQDPTAVRRALGEAQKAVDYMLNRSPTMRRMLGMDPTERKVDADLRFEVPMLEGMPDSPKIPGSGRPKGTFEMPDEDMDERLSSGKIEDFAKKPFKAGKTHNIGGRGWRAVDRESGDREVYHYGTMMGVIRGGKYYEASKGWNSVSDKQGIRKILRALGQDAPEPMENIQALDRLSSGKIEQFGTRPHVPNKVSFAGSNRAWKSVDMDNGDRDIYHYSTRMGFIRDGNFYQVSDGWGSVSDKQGIRKILRSLGQKNAIRWTSDGGFELEDERRLSSGRDIKMDKRGRIIDSTGRLSSGSDSGPIKPIKPEQVNNEDLHIKRSSSTISFKAAHRLSFEPTQQQRDIVDIGMDLVMGRVGSRILSVQAAAGTGKTTTLKMLARAIDQVFNLDLVDNDVELNHKLGFLTERFADDLAEMKIKDLRKIPIDQAKEAVAKLKERHGSKNLYYGVFNRNNQFEAERGFSANTGISTLDKLAFWGLRLGAADEKFGPHIAAKMQARRLDLRSAASFTQDGKPIRKRNNRKKKDGSPLTFVVDNYVTKKRVEITGENPVLEDTGLVELSKGEDFIRFFGLRGLFHDPGVAPQDKQKSIPSNGYVQFAQMTVDDLGFLLAKAVENWAYSTDEKLSAKHFALTPQQISEKRSARGSRKKRVVKGFRKKDGPEDAGGIFDEEEVDPLVDSAFFAAVAADPEKYIPKEWIEFGTQTVDALQNEFIKDKDGKDTLSPVVPDQTQMYKLFALSSPNLSEAKYMIGHADGLSKKQGVRTSGKIGDYVNGNGQVIKMGKGGKFAPDTDLDDVWVITSFKGERGKKGTQSAVIQKSFANPGRPASAFLIDEAQDLNPVMMQVLEANKENMPIILVGDSRQKVYGFRRAIDALSAINPDYVLPLNESFRFGSRIAYLANVLQFLGNIDDEEKGIPNLRMQFVSGHLQDVVRGQFDSAIELLNKKDRSTEDNVRLTSLLQQIDEEFKISKTLGPKKDGKDKNGELLSIVDDGIPDSQRAKILSDRKNSAVEEAMGEIWDSETPLLDEKGNPVLDSDGKPQPRGELLPTKGRTYAYLTRDNAEIFSAATRLAQFLELQLLQDSNSNSQPWERLSPQIATSAKKHDELVKFFRHAAWILGKDEYKLAHPERRPEASGLIGNVWDRDSVAKRLGQKRYQQMTSMWGLMFPLDRSSGKRTFVPPKQFLQMLEGYERDGAGGQKEWVPAVIIPERQAVKMDIFWPHMSPNEIDEIANRPNAARHRGSATASSSQRVAIPITGQKDRGEIYAYLEIDGGDEKKPGKWTGKVVISGWGLSSPRGRARKGGNYREDVKRIMSTNPKFRGKFKYVEQGDTTQRAGAQNINDAFVIDLKDVGGSTEKLSELVQEAAKEIRKAANTNGADAVVTTAQLFKGMEADDVVLGRSWQDAFESIDDILEQEGKISDAFREELNIVYVALTRARKRIDPGRVLAELYLGTRGTGGEKRRNDAVARLKKHVDELRKSKNPEDRKVADAIDEPDGFAFPYPEPEKPTDPHGGSKPDDDKLTGDDMKDIMGDNQDENDAVSEEKNKNNIDSSGEKEEEGDAVEVGDGDDNYDDDTETESVDDIDAGYGIPRNQERLSSGRSSYWDNDFSEAITSSANSDNDREVRAYINTSQNRINEILSSLSPIRYGDEQDDFNPGVELDIDPETTRMLNDYQERLGQAFNIAWAKERISNANARPKEKQAAKKIIQDANNGRLSSGGGPRRVTRTLEDVQNNSQYDWKAAGFRFNPNEEQQMVTDAVMTGEDVVVRALAGTGKTSTLELVAQRLQDQEPTKKLVYLTFTRKMTEEAVKKFAKFKNVEVRTWDSVAYATIVGPNEGLKAKLEAKEKLPNGKSIVFSNAYKQLAEHYGFKDYKTTYADKNGNILEIDVPAREQALIISKALNEYATKSDKKVTTGLIRAAAGRYDITISDELAKDLRDKAEQMWKDSFDPESEIQLPQNYVMKQFALSEPDLSTGVGMRKNLNGNDIILFDEAQDANPVMTAIVKNQNIQKIIVGDSNQAIYEFRGAVDELDNFDAKYDLTLSESYRFNEVIARFANRFLSAHQKKKSKYGPAPKSSRMRLIGRGADGAIVQSELEMPEGIQFAKNRKVKKDGERETFAYLTQTNASAFKRILEAQRNGMRTGSVSTFKQDLYDMVNHAEWLQNGKKGDAPKRRFPPFNEYDTWAELVEDATPNAPDTGSGRKRTKSGNVQAITAYRLMLEEKFNYASLRNSIDKIEVTDENASVSDAAITTSQIVDGAKIDIISDGGMQAEVVGKELALSFTDKAKFDMFMERKPIYKDRLGFKYDGTTKTWRKKFSSPEDGVKVLSELKNMVRDGLMSDQSDYDSADKVKSFIAKGSSDKFLAEIGQNGLGISFTTSPDGKVRAAITGNTYNLLGKAGPMKDKFKGAKIWRWDGDKKQWYFDAESPDEAFEKISATRKAMGIAEGEYLVKPLEKPNTDAGVDIVAQTAHRSKGLEYDYVVLGEDFKKPEPPEGEELPEDYDPLDQVGEEDVRLQYVAATRAKKMLATGSLSWIYDVTTEKDEESNSGRLSSGGGMSRRAARRERLSSGREGRIEDPMDPNWDYQQFTPEELGMPPVPEMTDEELNAMFADEEAGEEGRRARRIRRAQGKNNNGRLSSGKNPEEETAESIQNRMNTARQSATDARLDGFGGTREQGRKAFAVWSRARERGWPLDTSLVSSDLAKRNTALGNAIERIGERMNERGSIKVGDINTNNPETANPENWMLSVGKLKKMIRMPEKVAKDGTVSSYREITTRELASMLGVNDKAVIRKLDMDNAGISHNDVMNLIAEIGNQPEMPFWRLFSPTTPDEFDYQGEKSTLDRFFENANRSLMRQRFVTETFGKDAYPQWRSSDGRDLNQDEYEKMEDGIEKFSQFSGSFPESDKTFKDADEDLTLEGYDPETRAIPSSRIKMKNTEGTSTPEATSNPSPQDDAVKTQRKDFKLQELLENLKIDPKNRNWPEELQKKIDKTKADTELQAPNAKTASRWENDGVPVAVIAEMIRLGIIKDAKSAFKSNNSGERLDYELARRKHVVYEALSNFINEKFPDSPLNKTKSRELIAGNDIFQTLTNAAKNKGTKFSKLKGDEPRFSQSELGKFVNKFNEIFGTDYTIDDIFSDEQLREAKRRIEEEGRTSMTVRPRNRTVTKKEND